MNEPRIILENHFSYLQVFLSCYTASVMKRYNPTQISLTGNSMYGGVVCGFAAAQTALGVSDPMCI